MSEQWHVYRYSLSQIAPMLKADETDLVLTPGDPNWRACFQLKNRTVNVEMVADPTTDAWYGMDGSGKLHFRWSRIMSSGKAVLVGQVFDERAADDRRDFFVAVQSRKGDLPPRHDQRYDFAQCHRTPFSRKKLAAWTGISILPDDKKIEIDSPRATYTIDDDGIEVYKGGLKVTGWHGDESLELWLLPVHATGGHLVTGCYSHWPPGTHSMNKRPLDPDCVIGLHSYC